MLKVFIFAFDIVHVLIQCVHNGIFITSGYHGSAHRSVIQARSKDTIAQAFAPSTWSNINSHWRMYRQFCARFGSDTLPLCSRNVIFFLQDYSEHVSSFSTVANVFSSIKTVTKIKGFMPSQQFTFDVNLFLSGLKRCKGMSVQQMLPITPQILLRLHACIDFKSSFHVAMWAAMLFMFFTFFRKSNVLPISAAKFDTAKQVTRNHIRCLHGALLVTVNWSKTIQYCQRQLSIPVSAVPGSKLCPVQAFKQLLQLVQVPANFHAFCYFNLSGDCVPLTYTVFVAQLRYWLAKIGISNTKDYCTHSFRRGGTTFAFQCGVNPTLI